jgi:nucleotide-binding universal stress UspA family protein
MTDLIVLQVAHPPASGLAALRSPVRLILADSSRPVLGVPTRATRWQRALLAYDGGELAKEALFVAAYLGEIWKTELLVYTAQEGTQVTAEAQDYVRRYLEIHELEAECIFSEQGARDGLKRTAEERDVDLVLMGSHGGTVVRQVLIGSSLDYMLRESKVPLFICR